ncbi:aminotransferase class I/II-fold pyridoxal phosphate-dependent enzyme [Salinihabitans flavidus]|uniref:aminotransferase class I/II-fold pyridoxal phosphate-dependent enzyme n=1 Tax=Salinihabitans flavidus TaxID=569882 RepID=UPI001C31254F|nr:aminotransferase class I/II-fold pyridoxal phosphate-dependent enzyme [Salinihabitans flavidus]
MSGKSLIENGHPYFVPTDTLEDSSDSWPQGYLSLAHYDYLGLAHHPRLVEAAKAAIDRHGTGVGASRLVGGERTGHRALEDDLARFLGVGGVLSVISGYLTNVSLINHLLGPKDLVLADELAHNSIVIGGKSGRFDWRTFEHNNLDDLERILDEVRGTHNRVLIVTEGLFSMDGDISDLPRLLKIKEKHDAWLLLDEAHSYGVLGTTGRGLCEHFGIDPNRIELTVGTLSKSFASSGGFICANAEVIEWLRFTLSGFVYSVGLSPATVASSHAALEVLASEPDRVTRLRANSRKFLRGARARGLNTGSAIGEAVIPILFDTPEQCVYVAEALMQSGIYAPPIFHVGVPKDLPRIRFFLSANHTEADIERVLDKVSESVAATQIPERIGAE